MHTHTQRMCVFEYLGVCVAVRLTPSRARVEHNKIDDNDNNKTTMNE